MTQTDATPGLRCQAGRGGNSFTGDIYTTTSSAWLGTPYDASALAAVKVGMMTLTFSDQNLATMTYTVNGVTQTKVIVRQPY